MINETMLAKNNYTIEPASAKDSEMLLEALIEFDFECMPHLPRIEIEKLDFVLKNNEGVFMGGINAEYFWGILAIKFLCIDKPFRSLKLGAVLINHVEKLAKQRGCYMAHLDTFDFQAKDFYLRHGYEVFGVIEDCPPGHKRYFMQKKF